MAAHQRRHPEIRVDFLERAKAAAAGANATGAK
jgi:hypothetical protein